MAIKMDKKKFFWILIFSTAIFLEILFFWKPFQAFDVQKSKSADAEKIILAKMGECKDTKKRTDCLKQAAKYFLSQFSLKEISKIFEKDEKRAELIAICHEESHYLGREEFQKQGSIGKVFSSCNHSCLGGCYHGAVEGYFISKNITLTGEDDPQIATSVAGICKANNSYKIPQDYTECLHGLGHAVMFLSENDLIRSLKLCDNLNVQNERELCYTGSFMANVDGAQSSDHPSRYFKTDDLMYPCYILDKKYQNMCYTYALLQPHQADLETTIKICQKVPVEFREACFRTMGRDRVYNTADESKMKQECDLIGQKEDRNVCYQGVAANLVVRYGVESDSAVKFCSLLQTGDQEECFNAIFVSLANQTLDTQKLQSYCMRIEQNYYSKKCLERFGKRI